MFFPFPCVLQIAKENVAPPSFAHAQPPGLQVHALTFVHSLVTMFGMWSFAAAGMFEVKALGAWQARTRSPLSAARSTGAWI